MGAAVIREVGGFGWRPGRAGASGRSATAIVAKRLYCLSGTGGLVKTLWIERRVFHAHRCGRVPTGRNGWDWPIAKPLVQGVRAQTLAGHGVES
jgi:hypothetical protein